MGALGKLRTLEGNRLMFWCPGCKENHTIVYGEGRWSWNGSGDKPTFSPSILVRGGHYTSHHKQGDPCWCTFYAQPEHVNDPVKFKCSQCHSFVRDGKIQFLNDCSHELAGQTVELPVHPENIA